MPRNEEGLMGECMKEVWLPEAQKREHAREEAKYKASLPAKLRKNMVSMPFRAPYTSVGIAPTEAQVHDNDYSGAA